MKKSFFTDSVSTILQLVVSTSDSSVPCISTTAAGESFVAFPSLLGLDSFDTKRES